MVIDLNALVQSASVTLMALGWQLAGALALWLVGRRLISFAIRVLTPRLAAIPNVLASPAPLADVLQFTSAGPQLCVRPFRSNEHYWQVHFDTKRLIRAAFGATGDPADAGVCRERPSLRPAVRCRRVLKTDRRHLSCPSRTPCVRHNGDPPVLSTT